MPNDKEWAAEISLQELADLLEKFETRQSLDLGSTVLHLGVHVYRGPMMLVSTACGKAAAAQL